MRSLFFLSLVLIIPYKSICQQSDSTNIYLVSLTEHLKYWKSLNKNKESFITAYVEKNDFTTEALPEKIGDVTVFYLTRSEIQSKTREGKRIHLIVIKPVKVEVESLKVNVIDFFVSSKKNGFNYANSGGSTFEFKYDCDKKKFELAHKRQGGI